MVLVNEILDMVRHYVQGIPVNEETLALDLIDQVGPGGHYLQEEHTLAHFREMWYSDLFDRSIYARWVEEGEKQWDERLHAQTRRAITHTPAPLPEEMVAELDRMASHWR